MDQLRRLLGPLDDRTRIVAFATGLAAINGIAPNITAGLREHGVIGLTFSLAGVSAIFWYALCVVASIAAEPGDADPARRSDIAFAGLIGLLALVPSAWGGAIGVLLAGAFLWRRGNRDRRARRIGLVLLALTGTLLWGRILLVVVAPSLLETEAQLVAALAGVPSQGNSVAFAGDAGKFVIAPACSSLHNISLALILWASLTQALDLPATPRRVAVAVAGMGAMILVNAIRLAMIARFPAHFDSLHYGVGEQVFGWASLIVAGLVIGAGIYVTKRPAR